MARQKRTSTILEKLVQHSIARVQSQTNHHRTRGTKQKADKVKRGRLCSRSRFYVCVCVERRAGCPKIILIVLLQASARERARCFHCAVRVFNRNKNRQYYFIFFGIFCAHVLCRVFRAYSKSGRIANGPAKDTRQSGINSPKHYKSVYYFVQLIFVCCRIFVVFFFFLSLIHLSRCCCCWFAARCRGLSCTISYRSRFFNSIFRVDFLSVSARARVRASSYFIFVCFSYSF